MAESLQAEASIERLIFKGKSKAMGAAIAVLAAGLLTFSMGINRVFFVEAMAWTFIVWGALLLYGHIIDYSTTYEVTDDALIVRSPLRFWSLGRSMDWGHIKRMNVVVGRVEAEAEDATVQVIYTPEGSTQMIREDMPFNAALAQEIVTRAGLKAVKGSGMTRFDAIPQDAKGQYTWQ
ncbi:MAG: hypothetical protein HY328_09480 [Chloroflexi bacterium]|nr:hypothetical protein [Chloroflexota bacterium]